ncbi:MAG TPA: hypothetical protein VE967_11415, partial [Gemmatimonadaceae bacterium]|nr:hypothetical protein [Gemmatimonadaceae bacterium]
YREREWALAIIAIGLAVGTFALIARNTRILTHTDSTLIFMTMYGAAAAAFPFVLSRTGLGGWLQRWVVVYAEPVTPELSPAAR